MKDVLSERKKCTGCAACVNSCPQKCIKMVENLEGFYYPQIDESKCVKCGICIHVCPIDQTQNKSVTTRAYVCQSKDEAVWKTSSSAGVFHLLATEILRKNGVVFGAAYTDDFCVQHVVIDRIADLDRVKRSKYVQSSIEDTFICAKKYLENGKYVLFTGTACQISGLKRFLKKEYDRLYTQDLVCHGAPSPGLWKGYMQKYSQNGTIVDIQFRDKSQGWFSERISFISADGTKEFDNGNYYTAFLKGLLSRECCYQCQFKGIERESDITLSDCWGWKQITPDFIPSKGISTVLVHSKRGEQLFSLTKENMIVREVTPRKALVDNDSAIDHSIRPSRREDVFRMYQNHVPIEDILSQALKKPLLERLLLSLMSDNLKRVAHQIMDKVRKIN